MLANPNKQAQPNNQKPLAHLQVAFGGYSSAGKKDINQDAFAALIPKPNDLITKGVVATIADGVSSASKAKEAAQLSVTQFINDYYATPETWSTQKSAAKVLNSLNAWLCSQIGKNDDQTHLTTFSSLIIKSTTGYVFHIGDTRISLYRDQQIEAITQDHNRKQGNKNIILTRALGADHRLKVDVHKIDIRAGDIYLLTCDGVHEYLNNKEIKQYLNALPEHPNNEILEQTSHDLVELALKNGSDDNVSCLLVYIGMTPNRELAEIQRDLFRKKIPPALQVGMKIDNYKVCKVIHASTRSHLYLVEHPEHNKPMVLKVPSENFIDDDIYLQGFMKEAWLGERVNHSNIMKVTSAENNSHFLYHVCEYIEGQTLGDWMHDNPKPTIDQVRDIISQIITALRVFQRLDLVHRDLKPDNIMIDSYGHITLIDYGTVLIASLEENANDAVETVPQGTLNYIAPESLLTLYADHQSDLFSLGVIAYEMLCGELPYKPMVRAEVNFTHYQSWQYRSIIQFRPELPLWLDLSLSRATFAEPKLRYQAYSEFLADFSKPNTSAIQEYKNQPLIKRNPVQFWQGVSVLLFIALLLSLGTH
jgi:serine/threonine protein phosphatase PrpC